MSKLITTASSHASHAISLSSYLLPPHAPPQSTSANLLEVVVGYITIHHHLGTIFVFPANWKITILMKVKHSVSIPANYCVLLVPTLGTYQAKGRVAVGVSTYVYLRRHFLMNLCLMHCGTSWGQRDESFDVYRVGWNFRRDFLWQQYVRWTMWSVVGLIVRVNDFFFKKCSKLQKYEIVHSCQ